MKIYVDADACPKLIKDILDKAAIRTNTALVYIANQALTIKRHRLISFIQVGRGFDVADNHIADIVEASDLVITADIPLADKILDKQAVALNPRGELYTKDNIKQRLSVRNFMDEVRSTGVHTGGPKPISKQDIQAFANQLDTYLRRTMSH